ncbi:hypothetical protein CLV78_101788 [Aliiruegeria haliotis]|uniref:AbrB family transcriptional regulator n=1 Tax=Aliiruegeria haliotis TaxID=1280846 RepID=A0A2T0RZT0_9RHOB|nr:AbrB family transcriptional regulator [Aliiruegeria haliotis]PRY26687.1 hypothetical protein CLV78_101788 [Aliiruegeria haliotis]
MATDRGALRDLGVTLALSGLGAGLFAVVGMPAPALTGSATAVTLAVLAGLPMRIPTWLRDLCFVTLGLNIGSSVTPDVLRAAATWPLSFAVLAVTLFCSLFASRAVLERGFGYDRTTATLASTPGHLGYVLGLTADMKADIVTISLVQSTRVLFLTLVVPLVVTLLFEPTGATVLPRSVVTPLSLGLLYVAAFALGLVFLKLKLPAAFLLAGMAASAAGHLGEITPGRMPDALAVAALLVMGALIGTRFRGAGMVAFRNCILAGLCITGIALAFALLGATVVMATLGLPIDMLIVAFAPGGVEAMAAIAIQAGLDPTFVAAHHVARLALLTVMIPLLARHTLGKTD